MTFAGAKAVPLTAIGLPGLFKLLALVKFRTEDRLALAESLLPFAEAPLTVLPLTSVMDAAFVLLGSARTGALRFRAKAPKTALLTGLAFADVRATATLVIATAADAALELLAFAIITM